MEVATTSDTIRHDAIFGHDMRVIAIFLVVGLCGFAAARGWKLIEFVTPQVFLADAKVSPDRLRKWADTAGVAGAAREALLAQARSGALPIDATRWADGLTSLLEVRPLTPAGWLSLAGTRVVSGAPEAQVLSALTMSRISGPNEGAVTLQRGIFGLLQWETLPQEDRRKTARDLAGAMLAGSITGDAASIIRGVLAAKLRDVRAEISGMLGAEQVPSSRLTQIGL